mgnify:CR=1 FL=1
MRSDECFTTEGAYHRCVVVASYWGRTSVTAIRPMHHDVGKGRSVLLVEDEILLRIVLAENLRDDGWHVVEAATASEALDILRSSTFAVMLTDVHMPGGLTGLDLAREIRKTWPDLPVVVMSALFGPETVERLPYDAFLMKPVVDVSSALTAVIVARQG